jgi:hypothetical protein
MLFAWDERNIEHIAKHAVVQFEAEFVIDNAEPPWPEEKGDGKLLVWGPTEVGRLLQVVFVFKTADEVDFDALTIDEWADLGEDDRIVYVVHAMDLTSAMKRNYRKRRRRQ